MSVACALALLSVGGEASRWLALWVSLPFVVGMFVGPFVSRNGSLVLDPPLIAALVMPLIYVGIWIFFQPSNYQITMPQWVMNGRMVSPSIFVFISIPAIAGATLSRWLNRQPTPENRISD